MLKRFELAKWVAFAAMLIDHASNFYDVGLLSFLGRVSFPIFGLLFAMGLSKKITIDKLRSSLLLYFSAGFVAQFVSPLVTHSLFGNVLFLFSIALIVIYLIQNDYFFSAFVCVVLGGFLVEYWWFGICYVVAAWWVCLKITRSSVILFALSCAALCALNGNGWALLSFPVLCLSWWCRPVVHIKRLLLVLYPLHLAVLSVVVFTVPIVTS